MSSQPSGLFSSLTLRLCSAMTITASVFCLTCHLCLSCPLWLSLPKGICRVPHPSQSYRVGGMQKHSVVLSGVRHSELSSLAKPHSVSSCAAELKDPDRLRTTPTVRPFRPTPIACQEQSLNSLHANEIIRQTRLPKRVE
jgi:hypothetical protein